MIDMPEPMQEPVRAFGPGGLAVSCSTTECCCNILPTAAFAAAFASLSGVLLLKNMSTSVFAGMQCRNGQKLSCRDQCKRGLGCRKGLANHNCHYDKCEIAPELTGHGLPLSKCEAYNRVYDQF